MADIFDKLLLAKVQATKNVDAGPTAALNAIRISSMSVGVVIDSVKRKVIKPTMGELPHLMNKKGIQIEVECEVHGSGVAGAAPELAPLLQICALAMVPNAGVDVRFAPISKPRKLGTVYAYEDGVVWKCVDAVATASLQYTMDAIQVIKFTISAPWTDPVTAPMPANAVFQSTQPIMGDTLDVVTEAATAVVIGSLSLDLGNDIQSKRGTGQNEYTVKDRSPGASITKDSVSDASDWTALTSATDAVINAQFGQSAGNKLTLNIPRARRETIKKGEKADTFTNEVSFKLYESAGDDQFELIFS